MNQKRFLTNVSCILCVYTVTIIALILVRMSFPDEESIYYNTFRDLVPLIIAIPAAWLAYSYQRRQSYLKDVRDLYSQMVDATQDAIQYTYLEKPNQADFGKVLKSLSSLIEEIRSVFLNIGESEERAGLYPFEGIKKIHKAISNLGFGEKLNLDDRKRTRDTIVKEWKVVRRCFLFECARGTAVNPHSPYLKD